MFVPSRLSFSTCTIALFLVALIATGCTDGSSGSGAQWENPEEKFKAIVKAVQEKNGGAIYDMLDSARRAQVDTLIGAQLANIDSLPEGERGPWRSLVGKSKREVYAHSMASDPMVGKVFDKGAKVVKVDTVVFVTVEHGGLYDLLYLRPQEGKLLITNSPEVAVYGSRSTPRMPPQSEKGEEGPAQPR